MSNIDSQTTITEIQENIIKVWDSSRLMRLKSLIEMEVFTRLYAKRHKLGQDNSAKKENQR
jgi:hypothetical protein